MNFPHSNRLNSIKTFLLGCAMLALSACAASPQQSESEHELKMTECRTPRPEICTKEYRPVCGSVDTGIRCITTPCPSTREQTFGNACEACANPKVLGYVAGACKSAQ